METIIADSVKAAGESVLASIGKLQPALDSEIDLAGAKAEWDMGKDARNRDVVALHVTDALGGEVVFQFAPDELLNKVHAEGRLYGAKEALERTGKFKKQVNQLLDQVEVWVRTIDPDVYLTREPIEVRERRSGPYQASSLRFVTKRQEFRVEPIATWVVAADGRVDVIGPDDSVVLALHGDDWFWVVNGPRRHREPLNDKSFAELLKECSS